MQCQRKPYLDSLPLIHQGKVRDTFGTNAPDMLLIVATDAISTHNVAHLSQVPGKGRVLNALSLFWALEVLSDIQTHLVASGKAIYAFLPKDRNYPDDLHLRGIIVKRLTMAPHEFIFRARIAGSFWKDYYSQGLENPYGVNLPEGMEFMSPFPKPIFTPTTKSATDDPENSEAIEAECPEHVALTRKVYRAGHQYAYDQGIDIIDFKAEVGMDQDGVLHLGDEWLNGDCCRFVFSDDVQVGQEPPWADKEIFRKNATLQWKQHSGKPPLEFPPEVIHAGMNAYHRVFECLTGRSLTAFQQMVLN